MASHRRGPWSQGEDAYLCQLVHTQGPLNWVRIAQLIGSRSPKQCRERYHQNLKPSLNHEPISPEEGLLIERLVGEMGKRWAEIARRLNGRSDNAVKNWWNGSMNRQRRLALRGRTHSQCPNRYEERHQNLSFPRPAASRALTLTPTDFPSRRGVNEALPSPAVSEGSRAESVDGAPSLVSDNGSAFSVSPRLTTSPSIELPPLNAFGRDARRPSLPMLQVRPNTFLSEADTQANAFSSRFHGDTKIHGLTSLSSPSMYRRPEYTVQPPSPRDYHFESRGQLLTAPPTPVQLPPLQMRALQDRVQQPEMPSRDSRMTLSALLG